MPTETVIITGRDLGIEHTKPDEVPAGQPIRPRPALDMSTSPEPDARTVTDFIDQPNPYWPAEANREAETSNEKPSDIARRWAKRKNAA